MKATFESTLMLLQQMLLCPREYYLASYSSLLFSIEKSLNIFNIPFELS